MGDCGWTLMFCYLMRGIWLDLYPKSQMREKRRRRRRGKRGVKIQVIEMRLLLI